MNLSFSEKIKLDKNDLIITYRGRNQDKQQFFAYIICDAEGLQKMRSDYEDKKTRVLAEYGKVIYIGMAENPDPEAEQFLKDFIENYPLLKDSLE